MRLRKRLAIVLLGVAYPTLVLCFGVISYVRHRNTVQAELEQLDYAVGRELQQCRNASMEWPGARSRRAPLRDARRLVRSSEAETLAVARSLEAGALRAHASLPERSFIELAVRVDGQGPCAYVAVVRGNLAAMPRLTRILAWPALAIALSFGLLWMALGSPLRRLLALDASVQSNAPEEWNIAPSSHDDEIGSLSSSLALACVRLQASGAVIRAREQALEDYIAGVHHDLGVPLTVLQGHLAELERGARDGQQTVVRRAIAEAHYVSAMLANLAVAARLDRESKERPSALVDLVLVVERVMARYGAFARQCAVEVAHAVPEKPVLIRGELTFLERAVSNLVHNAIHHNREGGHVALVLEHERERFVLSIVDDGPGMTRQACEVVGTQRPDERVRSRKGGSGRGLWIVRSVLAMHDFDFVIEPAEEGGLRAAFSGPCSSGV